jgi:hypothetical protein
MKNVVIPNITKDENKRSRLKSKLWVWLLWDLFSIILCSTKICSI